MTKYINEYQVSEYTGISVHTLRRNRSQGTGIPYIKHGTRVIYAIDDIDTYLHDHLVFGQSS